LKWENSSDQFSSTFAVTLGGFIFLFPFVVWALLWARQAVLPEEEQRMRIGSTYLEIRTGSKAALLYNVLYMLRRLLFAVIATAFEESPVFQVSLLVFHCVLLLIYDVLVRPFEQPVLNRLEVFNEVCILGAAYHLYAFTDVVDDPFLQEKVGWSMIAVTTLNIATNMLVMIYFTGKRIRLALLKARHKYRLWRQTQDRAKKYSSQPGGTEENPPTEEGVPT
jgi:hypothetical protein